MNRKYQINLKDEVNVNQQKYIYVKQYSFYLMLKEFNKDISDSNIRFADETIRKILFGSLESRIDSNRKFLNLSEAP